MKVKWVALVTAFVICLTLLPVSAFAVERGSCGSHVAWELDGNGQLSVVGAGDMVDGPELPTSKIRSVVIQDGVTSIGSRSFYKCTNLTSVSIPESVTKISDYAFYNCTNLSSVSLPSKLTKIGNYAFTECTKISSVVIPSTVTDFGTQAFAGCSNLSSLKLSDGLTVIGEMAFALCTSLKSVSIPSSVKRINAVAFDECTALSDIIIAEGVEFIDSQMLFGCSSLTRVTIPKSVDTLGHYMFGKCTNLVSVDIQGPIEFIGKNAFYNCTLLKSVSIPSTVTEICDGAFYNCNSLTDVYYAGTKEQWLKISSGANNEALVFATVHYGTSSMPTTNISGFSDVADSSPFAKAVAWAVAQGITSGTSSTTFSPNTQCTWAHMYTFLWRTAGSPEPKGNVNIVGGDPNAYWYKALQWAYQGSGDVVNVSNFDPSRLLTRSDAVAFMWAFSGKPEAEYTGDFVDVTSDTSNAEAIAWAVSKGVTNGTDSTHFSPDATCTRGQVVTFLYRAFAK